MTQIAMKDAAVLGTFVVHGRRQRLQDQFFRLATLFFALLVLALLGGVILSLIVGASLALGTYGIGFLFTEVWNPVTEKSRPGADLRDPRHPALATLLGVPGARYRLFITELARPWL
jgi:phosphate transport system permease protein